MTDRALEDRHLDGEHYPNPVVGCRYCDDNEALAKADTERRAGHRTNRDVMADEYVELTGDDIPPHLRHDAPEAICNRCGRHSVAEENFGQEDRMTQPDGNPCGGRFSDPRGAKVLDTVAALCDEVDRLRAELGDAQLRGEDDG